MWSRHLLQLVAQAHCWVRNSGSSHLTPAEAIMMIPKAMILRQQFSIDNMLDASGTPSEKVDKPTPKPSVKAKDKPKVQEVSKLEVDESTYADPVTKASSPTTSKAPGRPALVDEVGMLAWADSMVSGCPGGNIADFDDWAAVSRTT